MVLNFNAQSARININNERVIGEVDNNIYGNFIEHLGRCGYEGIYMQTIRCPMSMAIVKI